ncbi:hypothetical protein QVD17_32658 [Tagetes erecta]|uniref:Benzyl alcohol O-benzoyltransferase n=1 Tax=Tagetes erecta TaxID=13708 RepID=A0AAD8NDH1_TARER|nr:hypothetical protein QVD17_32658 [Tagetes erecta]
MELPASPLSFVVRRHAAELISPAAPTPRELKSLSDIDDQQGLRYLMPTIMFYPKNPKMGNTNPASVIREALAKVLVYYHPLAGRIKEGSDRKLMVDCTAEGVMFIEAEANVTLEQFGNMLCPPFPCMEELLCNVPDSGGIIGSPLVRIQVTRLLCGGFIFTSQIFHTMCDGTGGAQFLIALGEMAQGALEPSVSPLWHRELLNARDPPCVTFSHPEYLDAVDIEANHMISATCEMADKSFFFGPAEMSSLRRLVSKNLQTCSNFELITAFLWRSRTIALQPNPEEDTHLMFFVNARGKFNPPIPVGYYGNCIVLPCVVSKAGDICNQSLEHALELVMKAKSIVTEEYVRSTTDLMVVKGRPHFKTDHLTFIVSNVTRCGFNKVNFGWGEAIYGGFPNDDQDLPGVYSVYMPATNDNGESGIVVIIGLPINAMVMFEKELINVI